MKRSGRLTASMMIIIFIGGTALSAALCIMGTLGMRDHAKMSAAEVTSLTASALDSRFETESRPVVRCAENVARYDGLLSQWVLYSESLESGRLYTFLSSMLRTSPYITSVGVLLDPEAWDRTRDETSHAPFAVRSADEISTIDLSEMGVDYFKLPIFSVPSADRKPLWSEAIVSDDMHRSAAAYLYPVDKGVIVCNVSSGWIEDITRGIAMPFDGSYKITAADGREIYGQPSASDAGSNYTLSESLRSMGWFLEVSYPHDVIFSSSTHTAMIMAGAAAAILLVTLTAAAAVTSSVSRQVRSIAKIVETMAHPSAAHGGDELSQLAQNIEFLHDEMTKKIEETEAETDETLINGIEADIAAVTRRKFIAPDRVSGERYSVATRFASEDGLNGNFCDVIRSDRGTVYLTVGTASGSGAEAAMSAAAYVSALRAVLPNFPEPYNAIAQMNELLVKKFGRDSSEKIWMIVAEFYPSTGTCVIAHAGCPHAMTVRSGKIEPIDLPQSAPVGECDDVPRFILNMTNGDALMLCTSSLMGDSKIPTLLSLALESERSCDDAVRSLKLPADGALAVIQYIV